MTTRSMRAPKAEWVEVSVYDVVQDSFAISCDEGTAVYEQIADALRRGETVVLSFAGIEHVATAFLDAAVGRLYEEFDEELIREKLRVEHAQPNTLVLLNAVIEEVKDYLRDPEGYTAALKAALNE